MASERPEGSGWMGDDWTPSPERLEERDLLSGLLDGLSDLGAGAPVEDTAVVPEPDVEEPPAVVEPLTHVSASAAPAQDRGVLAGGEGAPASSAGAADAPAVAGTADSASTPVPVAGASHAPGLTTEMPAAAEHSSAPGPKAVDSLLANFAVGSESQADSRAVDSAKAAAVEPGAVVSGPGAGHAALSEAAEAHAAGEGQARGGADVAVAHATGPTSAPTIDAVDAPGAGTVLAQNTATAESAVDGGGYAGRELECLATEGEATQSHMMPDVSSGDRTAETGGQEMPSHEDEQPEKPEAPIERSLVQSAGDHTASDPSWGGAEDESTEALQSGEAMVVEHAESHEELVSRVSQLFELVPNWPGVDQDAFEDAARSVAEDGAQFHTDFVDVVSTDDVSCWVTAAAGTAAGFGIARRELGLQTRDNGDGLTDEEVELCWTCT